MAPLIIAERRIILFLVSFIAGIICFHQLDHTALHGRQLLQITAAAFSVTVALLIMFIWTWVRARSGPFLGPLIYALFCCASGYALAALQYSLHQPVQLDAPFSTSVTAKIIHIDGQASGRSRLWLAVIDTMPRHPYLPDARLRLSSDHVPEDATIGAVVEMRARLFPPPKRLLPGIPDFGRNARIADIVASGFVTSKIQVVTPPTQLSPSLFLGRVRENLATSLHGDLATPAGGIAAALVVGDRRFISEPVYAVFRASGLAHLLAISGLHMGLLCFGCMAALRFFAALFPQSASRVAVHKHAAVMAVLIGFIYVILSGASVSAVRAFIMALLVIFAVLLDRRALTMRNVTLAAFVILAFNPIAVFRAGFQLSFAATAVLVMAYEKSQYQPHVRRYPIITYMIGIFVASLLANCATAPFAAQHFGSFTPWGVLANMIAIPLTGFLIMPSALLYVIALPLGLDGVIGPVFAFAILALVKIATMFTGLPFANSTLAPPGYAVLVLLVIAVVVSYVTTKPARFTGWGLGAMAIFIWITKPLPDAVLFAHNRHPTLVVASANGHLVSYGRLSDFLMKMAAFRLGQASELGGYQTCDVMCRHQLRSGQSIAIVTKRRGLSAACDDRETAFIISMVAPLYPCRTTKPIYHFTQRTNYNYLLFINKDSIEYVSNNSGSGQLACLVPQPHQC